MYEGVSSAQLADASLTLCQLHARGQRSLSTTEDLNQLHAVALTVTLNYTW